MGSSEPEGFCGVSHGHGVVPVFEPCDGHVAKRTLNIIGSVSTEIRLSVLLFHN